MYHNTDSKNNVIHRRIKKYSVSGVFHEDSQIPKLRALQEAWLESEAREQGYVPVLDIDTLWSTQYDPTKDVWLFTAALYCIYVGKRKAKEWEGWQSGKLIPRPTQKHTSNQS